MRIGWYAAPVMAAAVLCVSGLASAQSYNTCSGYNSSLNNNGFELTAEILNNPMATAALASSIAGLAGYLSNEMTQDQRNMMGAVGVVGALWCISSQQNQRACADTGAKLTMLLVERSQLESGFNSYSCWNYFSR